ncbi:hypothetical protein C9374_011843 [Naegleria lovaniensis]|uniref:tRNA-binding domain-containing protein n=1 Tax=Naegleria lovaniensis TaxID=51637 RepID=A0AA88GFQ2_NAELO|nr:uncharacterized protein C9374_011843 [Naegleria lovaniensis]KAG2373754.1 hypothetical protein C9374_011843 [Naegleria lovaniensis]
MFRLDAFNKILHCCGHHDEWSHRSWSTLTTIISRKKVSSTFNRPFFIQNSFNCNTRFYSTTTSEPISTTPLKPTNEEASSTPISNSINIEDFMKVEIVVGQILSAQFVKKSKKLICFQVNVGEQETRQILSGIRTHYPNLDKNPAPSEEELNQLFVGQKVLVVKNLEPKTMAGLQSHGMILFATIENSETKTSENIENTITPIIPKDYERVKPGTRVY